MPPLREPIKVVADVLQDELELEDGQIMLENQKWNISKSAGLYIALSYINSRAVSVQNKAVALGPDPDDGMEQQQSAVMLHLIQIDIMSQDRTARTRLPEVYMALGSIRAERAMEENNLQIARQAGMFSDVSTLEETVMLNRFTGTIAVTALHLKSKAIEDYYNEFQNPEVIVNE